MSMEEELQEMEAELRRIIPSIAAKRPYLMPKLAATNLASKYELEGMNDCVPCPVCGEMIHVSRIEFGEGKGSIWIGCKKNCTVEHLQYGPSKSSNI